jgi:hypothetical protein
LENLAASGGRDDVFLEKIAVLPTPNVLAVEQALHRGHANDV